MPSRGDKVVYRSVAGFLCRAEVVVVRTDGRLDLDVDAGSKDPQHLTRVEFVEEPRPGTCWKA